jgi:hypothetical protein
MPTRSSVIVTLLFAISASVAAQGPTPAPAPAPALQPSSASIPQLVAAQCPKFSAQLVDRPELKPILSQRPVDIPAVCACTQRSFLADARLQKAINVDDQALAERMQDERMRSYLTIRLMASVLECLTPELERAMAAASPLK